MGIQTRDDDSDVILLENVQVPASLGVTKAERRMRRPIRIDLEVGRSLVVAGRSDRIADTIDYSDLYDVVAVEPACLSHERFWIDIMVILIVFKAPCEFSVRPDRISCGELFGIIRVFDSPSGKGP